MQIVKKSKGQFVILDISGNLDMNNVKIVKQVFDSEIDKGVKYIAINMKDITYMDSSGIGAFIGVMRRLREVGGEVILFNMPVHIERIFQMTKLLVFFKVYKTEDEFFAKRVGTTSAVARDKSFVSTGGEPYSSDEEKPVI